MEEKVVVEKVATMLRSILEERGISRGEFPFSESLYEDGIGLDSLDTATFSVMLERAFGTDPYSDEQFPRTFGDVVYYYARGEGV